MRGIWFIAYYDLFSILSFLFHALDDMLIIAREIGGKEGNF
jgi:hypothetical protein